MAFLLNFLFSVLLIYFLCCHLNVSFIWLLADASVFNLLQAMAVSFILYICSGIAYSGLHFHIIPFWSTIAKT